MYGMDGNLLSGLYVDRPIYPASSAYLSIYLSYKNQTLEDLLHITFSYFSLSLSLSLSVHDAFSI